MSLPSDRPSDRWMDTHLEAYVDGALSAHDEARFEAGMRADPTWQDEIEQARTIRTFLRTQNPPAPPDHLTNAILDRASATVPHSEKEA